MPVPESTITVREYRVIGAKAINAQEIGEAVYPYAGPRRSLQDVEAARAALEKVYKDKGFQTVTVDIPEQDGRAGIVFLRVSENKVGRLRVKGSRYFSLEEIRKRAPSLAEGGLPNFTEIERDIVSLNQWPDRKVTPTLRAGVDPGTVDIDLEVKDTFPLHGSLELNNRYSADTTELRLNASLSYSNLWQAGHTIGFSFQVAPERPEDATIYSAYYVARFPTAPWLSVTLTGTKQESDVATLGGVNVVSPGETVGIRFGFALPGRDGFSHSLSMGVDYKNNEENVFFGLSETTAPVTYYPNTIAYNAVFAKKERVTQLDASVVFHYRGLGDRDEFANKRFGADTDFFYLRGELSHTQPLPKGFELFADIQGQASPHPLINSEQFSGGGLSTVRGYLESAVLGDSGLFGTLELRSPSLAAFWHGKNKTTDEWRLRAFIDAGFLTLNEPLPEQISRFELASYGVGSTIRLFDYFNGSIDAGIPLIDQGTTESGEVLFTFRVWGDF